MSDNRPPVYYEQGRWVYRASSLGSCPKALMAARMGMQPAPPPPKLQAAFDEGHAAESLILEQAADWFEADIHSHQETVEIKVDSKTLIRGSIDGAYHNNVIDAKNLHPATWNRWSKNSLVDLPFATTYAVQAYSYVVGREAGAHTWAVRNKETGEIFYYTLTREALEDLFGLSFARLLLLVKNIETLVRNEDLLMVQCEERFGCPYFYIHNKETGNIWWEDESEITYQDKEVIVGIATAKSMADENFRIAKEAKDVQDRLLREYVEKVFPLPSTLDEDSNIDFTIEQGPVKVQRWKSNRKSTDFEKMKEDGIDLDKYQSKGYFPVHRVWIKDDDED